MPDGVWVDQGLAQRLKDVLDNPITQLQAWQILLFRNDFTPGRATVLADLVEVSWPGYTRIGLTPSNWTAPVVVDGVAGSTWGVDPIVWLNAMGPAATVYGYAIYDAGLGQLVHAQRFDTNDIRSIDTGESIGVLPSVTLASAAP